MIVEVVDSELERLIVTELGVQLSLKFDGNLRLSTKVKNISAELEVRVEVQDGTLELDMETVKVGGLGFFGVPRKFIGDLIIKQAKNFPQITVWKNNLGNLQLSVAGLRFVHYSCGDGRLSLEAVCLV